MVPRLSTAPRLRYLGARVSSPFLFSGWILLFAILPADGLTQDQLDFNRDIRPILSDNCFLCHGPAESTREADLRLDDRDAALDSDAFEPGDPALSHIISRINSSDPDEIMPPPDSNKKLSKKQKEMLERWVAQGAEYQQHWSFVPPKKTQSTDDHPVDHFVERQLKPLGLQLSPEADLATLIRRVTLDLNGLPPTLEQVSAFIDDVEARGIESAYETVVDRLLAAPAYGERMALSWLDAARYGDTSVMHADGPRDMWPWRDWVIKAYNSNMPFDQFTIEQLAGDLIPNATTQQKVASGFNRNHATSDEGGAFAEELRVEYVVDRVMTTATVWMALTMECSQCHDHKYDPISQKEYYQFFAYFNNTTDPGMQSRSGNQKPVVEVISDESKKKLADAQRVIDQAQQNITDHQIAVEPEFVAWAKRATEEASKSEPNKKELTGLVHWFPLNELTGKKIKNSVTDSFATLERGKLTPTLRDNRQAISLDGATQFACDKESPELKNSKPFSFAVWIKSNGKSNGAVFSRMDVGQSFRGYDLWIQSQAVGTHIINTWPSNAIKVVSKDKLKANTWQHVVISYDGTQKASGVKIYIDGKLSENNVEADTLTSTLETKVPFKIGSRSNGANWKGAIDDVRIYNRALTPAEVPLAKDDLVGEILAIAPHQREPGQTQTLRNYYLTNEDNIYKNLSAELAKAESELASLKTKPPTSMIMQDNPNNKLRMTYVLDRGQYDSPQKEQAVTVGVPAALPALPDDAPANRLGLAQWLTQPDHPLTARVAVNRYWMLFFGQGLVRTAGDFGAQGIPPTHPELLDWLAVEFVESGWDVKRMIKLLVMSKTYRQSSRRKPVHQKADPENLLLAHSPRFRLQGELIRDQALAVSRLLVDVEGGPSVKPYQPPNIWNEVSLNGGLRYQQGKGSNLYRKSMYTYWKRSAPMPNMMIFDSPSREKCVVQRARTNTPLQALVTLNDPQFVEAARMLALRLLKTESGDRERIDLAYRLCTARSASQREQMIIQKLLSDQKKRFKDAPEKANQLLGVGESPQDSSTDAVEHAAWTVISQMILNLDETLTRG